jgi:hypothetical protein
MIQKSMVHLIFIVVLEGWHNFFLSVRIAIGKPELRAGPDERDQLPLRNAVLLNTYVKSKKLAWENPAAASAYTSRSVTVLSPATTPSAPQYYLGRKTTFLTTKQRAIHLQTGGGSRFFTEPRFKDFYDQLKASLLPPAPNISRSIPKQRGNQSESPTATTISTCVATKTTEKREPAHQIPPAPNINMMSARNRQDNTALKQIQELCLTNKKKNDEIRKKQEEEEKRKKDKEHEARQKAAEEEKSKCAVVSPQNLHDIMNGIDTEQSEGMDYDMEVEENYGDEERSPLKKRSGSRKLATRKSRHPKVNPPSDKEATVQTSTATKTSTFLDTYIHPHSRTVLELAIKLKSNNPFEEFTKSLMDLIANAQIVDSRFVINPIDSASKEKNISSKGEISSNMTKLGMHIKISGNGNAFNKRKVWGNQEQERKSRKNKKEEFRDPTVYFSMIVSTEVKPQELIDRITHEWVQLGGARLQIKDLQIIESETVVTFFRVSTMTPKSVLLAELKKILLETQQRASKDLLDTSTQLFP